MPIADVFKEPKSVFGIVGMYTYGILKLDKLNDITLSQVGLVKSTPGLLVKVVFDGLFILVYLLLLAALFIALFVRGVRIWLYIMLSPAFGLMYFFHQSKGAGDMGEFGILEFVKLALVPIYVGTALSFGMLFLIIVGKQMQFSTSDCSNSRSFMCCSKTATDIPTCTITA